MHPNEYQNECLRTAGEAHHPVDRTVMTALGIAGEAGEYVDMVKKAVYHGHALDREKALLELGDILWYVAVAAHERGATLDVVMAKNIDKLRRRYPAGFSHEASLQRAEA